MAEHSITLTRLQIERIAQLTEGGEGDYAFELIATSPDPGLCDVTLQSADDEGGSYSSIIAPDGDLIPRI